MFERRESLLKYSKNYPVIISIILLNILVFVGGLFSGYYSEIVAKGATMNYLIEKGEVWRLLTAVFIHDGFSHLIFNIFALYVFAPIIEKELGKFKFLIMYLSSGVLGNFFTYLLKDDTYSSVGASGAVFGVLGAVLALAITSWNKNEELKITIIPVIIISIVLTFLQPNINETAHIGGFLSGLIISLVFLKISNKNIKLKLEG